jgi:hypothetical protein
LLRSGSVTPQGPLEACGLGQGKMPDASPLCRSANPGAIPLLVGASSATPMPRTAAQRATTSAGRGIDVTPIGSRCPPWSHRPHIISPQPFTRATSRLPHLTHTWQPNGCPAAKRRPDDQSLACDALLSVGLTMRLAPPAPAAHPGLTDVTTSARSPSRRTNPFCSSVGRPGSFLATGASQSMPAAVSQPLSSSTRPVEGERRADGRVGRHGVASRVPLTYWSVKRLRAWWRSARE